MSTSTEMSLLFPEASPEVSESDIKAELSKIKESTAPVSGWEVKFDLDHANLPAIYIYGIIEDDEIKDEKVRFGRRMEIRTIVRRLVAKKVDSEKFVYVHFRMPSDSLSE